MDNVRVLYTYDEFMALDEETRLKYFELVSLFAEPYMKLVALNLMYSVLDDFLSVLHGKDKK